MPGKRKTEEDYRQLAAQHALNWVGKFPPTVLDKTLWECEYGHQFMKKYNTIQQGSNCPTCAAIKRRLKPRRYHDLALKRNAVWIGESPKDTHQKTLWECKECRYCWHASYNYLLYDSSGCPQCAIEQRKLKSADYLELAQRRGFCWIGNPNVPENAQIKTTWEGKCRHHWVATFRSIKRGSGCPICAIEGRRLKPADYFALAEKRGFNWISDSKVPHNVHVKTKWRCAQGHEFEAPYNNILQGLSCAFCTYERYRLKSKDYFTLAEKRGFSWIGGPNVPRNALTRTQWGCEHNHQWETSFSKIQWGTGCPECISMINGRRYSKVQKQLCEIVNGELNHPFGSYCIDIALVADKIAIEYDSWYWHGNRLENDRQRDQDLLGAGWRVLHVRSNNKLPTKAQLNNAITQLQSDKIRAEIVLDDWGQGPTFMELRK